VRRHGSTDLPKRIQKEKPKFTQGRLKELLDYDPADGLFRWKKRTSSRISVGDIAGGPIPAGYWIVRVDGKNRYAHRLAWFYVHGAWPPDHIDHINRDRGDNRIANLRLANGSQNNGNRGASRNNTTGEKNVSFHKGSGKYRVTIGSRHGKTIYGGYFHTIDEAAEAARAYRKIQFGEFSCD